MNYETKRLPARLPQNVDHNLTTPQPCESSAGPVAEGRCPFLEAPFRAEILVFGTEEDKPYQIVILTIRGKPTLAIPLLDMLSPRKVRAALVARWHELPTLPRGQDWDRCLNRWLTGIRKTQWRSLYHNAREYLASAYEMVRVRERAGAA